MNRSLLLVVMFLPVVFTSGRNTFTDGMFQYKVWSYVGNVEVEDSAVTITSIDRSKLAGPFYGKELVIPATVVHNGYRYKVEAIGDCAFAGCNDFERVVISEGIEWIEGSAFNSCNNLQSVFIPSTVSLIESNPFTNCLNLKEIIVDEKNTIFNSRNSCNAIIETASGKLVAGCYTTKIPESVKILGHCAFKGCLKLEHMSLPEGITELEWGVFKDCANLISVHLPHSLEKIDGSALFYNCTRLKSVHIPENVSAFVEDGTLFGGCISLDSVTVDSRNKYYDSRNNCNAIIETASGKLVAGCGRTRIPDGVKEIQRLAFFGTTIRDINIPASVTTIHHKAFADIKYCTSMTVDEKNAVYDSRQGCNAIIEKATNKVIAGCLTTVIPESVTEIGCYAFYRTKLSDVFIIPNRITKIGGSAFCYAECDKLLIPESVKDIEDFAFSKCSFNEICWLGHVEEIKPYCFANCPNLQMFHISDGTKRIDHGAFEDCPRLEYISLPESLEQIKYSAFSNSPCEEFVKKYWETIFTPRPKSHCPVCGED